MINFPTGLLAWTCFIVWLIDWWFKSQNSYLVSSGAYPNSTHVIQSTHYFQIWIVHPISQLLIETPDRVGMTGQISVMDQYCKSIDFTAYRSTAYLIIELRQPILPGQILSVAIHGIKSSVRSSQTWIYSLYGRNMEGGNWQSSFTLLGIARIATYYNPREPDSSAFG